MTPTAVAPPAPVTAPQTAAPPGGGGPNGPAQGGTPFGTILNSARTAPAEGPTETGTKSGDHGQSKSSSSKDGGQSQASATPAEIAAAGTCAAGQQPAPASSGKGSKASTTSASYAAGSAGGTSGADLSGSALSASTPGGAPGASSATPAAATDGPPSAATTPLSSTVSGGPGQAGQPSGAPQTSGVTGSSDIGGSSTAPTSGTATAAQVKDAADGAAHGGGTTQASVDKQDGRAQTLPGMPVTSGSTPITPPTSAPEAGAATQRGASQSSEPSATATAAQTSAASGHTQTGNAVHAQAVNAGPVPAAASSSAANPSGTTVQPTGQDGGIAVSPSSDPRSHTGTDRHAGSGTSDHGWATGQGGATTGASAGTGSAQSGAFTIQTVGAPPTSGAQHSPSLPQGLARSAVTLHEAVDAVKATFTAANQAGVSSARISLSPESLGGIKISLSQTPDGLIARVAADHPEAAQTLQQNAAELRRSLEASGMPLLRLDIGSSGQQGLGSFAGSGGDWSGSHNTQDSGQSSIAVNDTAGVQPELTVQLASGSLVNVLA